MRGLFFLVFVVLVGCAYMVGKEDILFEVVIGYCDLCVVRG